MKYLISLLFVLLLANSALADGNIMTVYCDGSAGTNTFNEGEEVCIYGVGFEENSSVDIVLENEFEVVASSSEDTNNMGVISLRNIWSNIKAGVYNFFADMNGNQEQDDDESSQSLFVIGEQPDNNETNVEEVPEFGTIASAVVLIIAGLYIYKKREN